MEKQISIFNVKIDSLSLNEFVEIIHKSILEKNKIIQNGINAASVDKLVSDENLRQAYKSSDLINIDGMSMVWALRFLGYSVPERVACPDLADRLLHLANENHFSLFLLGASDESITTAVMAIKRKYPGIIISGFRNGFFDSPEEEGVFRMINEKAPDMLFLGMPTPKKELFIHKFQSQLNVRYTLGVGGLFDIYSGRLKRAPDWMQKLGIEWIYRFLQEPGRLWRRYLFGNFRFLLVILKERFKKAKP